MNPKEIIIRTVLDSSKHHGITVAEIMGYERRRHIVAARHDAWRAAHAAGVPQAEIGRIVGRDQTTVGHAIHKEPA